MTQNKAWIGFDQMGLHGDGIKVFDYCAGTGLFSRALAPHVSKILGMDSAQNMVIEYNKHAEDTQEAHPECEMRAVVGDLVYGRVPVAEISEDFLPFDLLAMCVSLVSFVPLVRSYLTTPKACRRLLRPRPRLRRRFPRSSARPCVASISHQTLWHFTHPRHRKRLHWGLRG